MTDWWRDRSGTSTPRAQPPQPEPPKPPESPPHLAAPEPVPAASPLPPEPEPMRPVGLFSGSPMLTDFDTRGTDAPVVSASVDTTDKEVHYEPPPDLLPEEPPVSPYVEPEEEYKAPPPQPSHRPIKKGGPKRKGSTIIRKK